MKKIIFVIFTVLILNSVFYAEESTSDSDWKESGKNALEATGKFFKDLGSSIEEKIDNATEVKCYGKWTYKSDNVVTTFICNEDGTMEISKKVNRETDYWKGTFTSAIRTINFKITEAGRKGILVKASKAEMNATWTLTYFVEEEGKSIKIYSSSIPTDIDGTDFSKGIVFTKEN